MKEDEDRAAARPGAEERYDLRAMSPRLCREDDLPIIAACLHAAANGPFFPDWEFQTLFGLERHEIAEMAERWPAIEDSDRVKLAVNNALVLLVGYPHEEWSQWTRHIPVSPERVEETLERWREAMNEAPG